MDTTLDKVLTGLATDHAKKQVAAANLVAPELLKRHLVLASGFAGLALLIVVCLALATRTLPMTDKQIALSGVVAFTAASVFVIALLSAGATAASVYARQQVVLSEALQAGRKAHLLYRQAELDASEELEKHLQTSFAMQVGVEVMWAELRTTGQPDRRTLEEACRYLELLSIYTQGLGDDLKTRTDLSNAGEQMFQRYGASQGGLAKQPLFSKIRVSFDRLKLA